MSTPVTEENIQAAFISYLKAQPTLTSLIDRYPSASGTEIREYQWQGADFAYPALRIYVDVYPSINGCGTDNATVCIETYSEEKSSKQVKHISGVLLNLLQKRRFKAGGLDFPMVRITNAHRAVRDVYAWKSKLELEVLVNSTGAIDARN